MNIDKLEKIRATILVVDDDLFSLRILGVLLTPHYHVLAAPSGEHALKIAAGEAQPDLILLDVLMPEMDGYEVFARLRENPRTRAIPIIFTSGLDAAEDKEKSLKLGAVDFLSKPYHAPTVLAHVRDWLECNPTEEGANQPLLQQLMRYTATD